jgi:hypothetical protein
MATRLARFPFVSKADILRAYRPGSGLSERTFRTLREHGWVSPGVVIRHRRAGRVVGQLRFYAALNVDAVTLARHEQPAGAVEVAEAAARFEEEWQPTVAALIEEWGLDDFEAFRAARNQLVHGLAPVSEQIEELHARLSKVLSGAVSEEFVRVGALSAQWATLDVLASVPAASSAVTVGPATAALGEIVARGVESIRQVAVDSFLPSAAALGVGDLAVLRIEHSGGTSLLSLLAATGEAEEPYELDDEAAVYFSDEPLPVSVAESVEARRAAGGGVVVPPLTVPLSS